MCCVGPLLVLVTGTGSALSSLSWLSNARPYLIGISIVSLGMAFWEAYKQPNAVKDDYGCEVETKKSLLVSKTFLWGVTFLTVLFFLFPFILAKFQPKNTESWNFQEANSKIELSINGMTCESCELHIVQSVQNIDCVFGTNASFAEVSTPIWFDRNTR